MTQPPTPGSPVEAGWPPPLPEQDVVVEPRAHGWAALRSTLSDLVLIVGALALFGFVCGLIWSQVVEPSQMVRFEDSVGQDEVQLQRIFAGDGWYVVVGLVGGLVAGVVCGFVFTRDLVVTVLFVVGGAVGAAFVMQVTGEAFGPSNPRAALEQAAVGDRADAPLVLNALQHPAVPGLGWELGTWSTYFLVWPLGALGGLMLPLLSKHD